MLSVKSIILFSSFCELFFLFFLLRLYGLSGEVEFLNFFKVTWSFLFQACFFDRDAVDRFFLLESFLLIRWGIVKVYLSYFEAFHGAVEAGAGVPFLDVDDFDLFNGSGWSQFYHLAARLCWEGLRLPPPHVLH